jgi:hypothetical protein
LAKPKGLVLEEDLVAQEFDLEEITGRDLSDDDALIDQIGKDIAEFIRKRADANKGIGGKALRSPYSKSYAESTEFKAHGKSPQNVNMRLTGEMLEAINVLDIHGNTLVVGIEGEQAPKAHGHMTGRNGEVPAMKREFFGLTRSELKNEILSKYKSEIADTPSAKTRVGDFESEIEREINSPGFRIVGDLFEVDDEF